MYEQHEWQAEKRENDNRLELREVALAVQSIPCVTAVAGFQQPQPVVVIEGPDRHTGEFGKLASPIEPGQTRFHVRLRR